jgi:hypothetical protein
LPKAFHRFSVAYSHFVQVLVPVFVFAPQPIASIAAAFLISQQFLLIVSGNYSWLNWLTLVLGITAFSDKALRPILPLAAPAVLHHSVAFDCVIYALTVGTVVLSVKPLLNLFSRDQLMNYSWNRYHLVNAYGAFGSMTKERYEIVLEGTDAPIVNAGTQWKAYEFKGKPGDPMRRPPQVAPYHLRLDWLMWFLPFSVRVVGKRLLMRGYEMWFIRFILNLLQNDARTLRLMRHNPFPDQPPQYLRASYYLYEYTTAAERRETGAWWKRTFIDYYLPPVSLAALEEAVAGERD